MSDIEEWLKTNLAALGEKLDRKIAAADAKFWLVDICLARQDAKMQARKG